MRLLAVALLLLAMPLSAGTTAASVQPFSLSYSVYRNQAMLGVAELRNKQVSPGYWQFITKTTATQGVATIAGASIHEQSNLITRNGLLELFSNQLETKVAWKTMQKTTKLDDAGKTYVYKDSKGTKLAPYRPGLLDQHSLTLALIADLTAQKKGPSFVYMVVNREKVEPYTFKIVATQTISTALGKLDTIRVDRIRESSNGKTTRIWFAVDKNYMPVLIQQNDENGDDIEMRIAAIK
jgi:hypothetical protein